MHQSDFDGFVDIIQAVSEQYGKRLSDSVLALYWQGLQDFDLPAVKDALGRHLRNTDTGQFMPKIADIIRMLQGSSQDCAFAAWTKVDKAVRTVGPYESVVFDDPIIHRVLHDMGGWLLLCDKTDDDWPFVAKEFENRYRGFKSKSERIDFPSKLIGLFEKENTAAGRPVKEPLLIGDATKAQKVLTNGSYGLMLGITRARDSVQKLSVVIED